MSFDKEHDEYSADETSKRPNVDEKISVVIKRDGENIASGSLMAGNSKIVIVINNQFTSSPNTTQIASGAGRNSAAGNNAALDSSNTEQQQSVGAGGEAKNNGVNGNQSEPHVKHGHGDHDSELVIILNNQINHAKDEAGVTQVASGAGEDSTAGTNAAIASSNTKQQHAVGGDGTAVNDGENGNQEEY